jgi:hypothetical protein
LTRTPLQCTPLLDKDHETEYQNIPKGGDVSFVNSLLECVRVIGRQSGLSQLESLYLLLLFKYSFVKVAMNDLLVQRRISGLDKVVVALGCSALTSSAAWFLNFPDATVFGSAFRDILTLGHAVNDRLAEFDDEKSNPPLLNLLRVENCPDGCYLNFFGRFRRDFSIEKLAGDFFPPPIVRPVELTLVPDRVTHFLEMTKAMRHCLNLCVLLSNQRSLIRNSYTIRLCLIEHLFLRVIPLPLPVNHPERESKCFWHSQPMRYETQSDTLRLLNILCRHFAAASLSVKMTRSGDAMRILVFACMATVCDATLRKLACDIPSQSSLHYSGTARGPVRPFGFDIGSFSEESEYLKMVSPESVAARTLVLDYFQDLKKIIPPDNYIFRFSETKEISTSDKRFVDQLSLQMGFDRGVEREYITGTSRAFLDYYPEISYFRDLIFMFKLVMVPSSDQLPDLNRWSPGSYSLVYTFSFLFLT